MPISLYDATVASFLQIVTAAEGVLARGRDHCEERGLPLSEITETRLYPDMQPFYFQVRSVAHHSQGAIEGVRRGSFSPPSPDPLAYQALEALVAEARAVLESVDPAEIDSFQGKDMLFVAGERQVPFTAENFLLSLSLPNLHFHATTTYDILRMKGVPLGKRDYLGKLRVKA